ncbi:MAG TPA: Xaa-Pro peptidase family protein [Woeseiaceae bacterium]|nr:Xaa-Pro peptidase family protein [Woeseiaceae bacterium]
MRDNPELHFTREEYNARLRHIWAAMQARQIDLLLLSDPCNLYYASGYDAWSFYVPQCLLVEAGNPEPVWIGREMDRRGAYLTSYLASGDIEGYPDDYVQAADRHPMSFVASVIRSRGWEGAAIGIERNSYYLGAGAFEVLDRELPAVTWIDAGNLVNWVRVRKSPAEIAYMRQAARIVERAMGVGIETIRVGIRQCDVAAAIYAALISGTSEFGGQYASSPPLMPSGSRADTPHLSWTDERYAAGSITNFELVAARFRYHVPLARSVSLGSPAEAVRKLERALVAGIDAVLSQLRPGVRADEVEAMWQDAAQTFGVRKKARCGYSIGIAYPPTFGEQTVSLRPGDDTVLEAGMTLHLMPAVWQEGASLAITEPLLVTESGCEALCRFERCLFVRS